MADDEVILFVEDSSGPKGYSAVFEATDGSDDTTPSGGYLYIYDTGKQIILRHLEVYKSPAREIRESDIQLFWSDDGTKCGVAIWGRMRGIIDIASSQEFVAPLDNPASPAITDPSLLGYFGKYIDQELFIRARQKFWKQKVVEYESDAQPLPESETEIETKFIIYKKGANHLFAVFEDDGDTGYLYAFNASEQVVVQYLQIYDEAKKLDVLPEDVQVVWSNNYSKCGVLIWNKMRGIVDRTRNQEGRVKLENRDTPGIGDTEWLTGFEYEM